MDELVIETHELTKRFGPITAVDGLSLRVPRGQVFGLLGPNGSGKTTTMGMVLGLVRPTAGSVRLFGIESAGSSETLRRVGAIVESPTLYPHLTGRANLRYFQGIGRRGRQDDIDRLLGVVGLTERADSAFRTYSLGMKQRLGLAYALLGDPEPLILDEPTNGMDPAGMAEVRELIRKLGNNGYTVLLSSHLLREVEDVCDSVGILSRGRLIAQGRMEELLAGRSAVRIRATDDARAAEIITSLSWISELRREDGALVVTAPPQRSVEIAAALSDQGVHLREMSQIQESLEEYFLQVTGEDTPPSDRGKA